MHIIGYYGVQPAQTNIKIVKKRNYTTKRKDKKKSHIAVTPFSIDLTHKNQYLNPN